MILIGGGFVLNMYNNRFNILKLPLYTLWGIFTTQLGAEEYKYLMCLAKLLNYTLRPPPDNEAHKK